MSGLFFQVSYEMPLILTAFPNKKPLLLLHISNHTPRLRCADLIPEAILTQHCIIYKNDYGNIKNSAPTKYQSAAHIIYFIQDMPYSLYRQP